ncbi:MAG: hypothetical protein WD207_11810, partial [Xanthobacteraceae bacterium]
MSEFPSHYERLRAGRRVERHARVAHERTVARAGRTPSALPLELAAFEGMVDPALLEAAARRAEALGVGGDEVLRAHGVLPPDLMARTLAEHLGLAIDPLAEDFSPRHLEAACAGVLARIGLRDETLITVAPRGDGIRRLAETLAREPRLADHLRL